MKFNILRSSTIYGGGPSRPEFKIIHAGVSEDFVKGFFINLELKPGTMQTYEDSMGCFNEYKAEVSNLEIDAIKNGAK